MASLPFSELLHTLQHPMATSRALGRLYSFTRRSNTLLSAIPMGASDRERTLRSQVWGAELLEVLGVDLHVLGEAPRTTSPMLVMASHRSYVDILILLSLLPVRFLAKSDVANWPVVGVAATAVNTIYVERDQKSSRASVRATMEDALTTRQATVCIFPEGTTSRPPGCSTFFRGGFEVAVRANVPILPIAIDYLPEDIWSDTHPGLHFIQTFSKESIPAWVVIGEPIHPPASTGAITGGPTDAEGEDAVVNAANELMDATHSWINNTLINIIEPQIRAYTDAL